MVDVVGVVSTRQLYSGSWGVACMKCVRGRMLGFMGICGGGAVEVGGAAIRVAFQFCVAQS